jgi:hypothetical protein
MLTVERSAIDDAIVLSFALLKSEIKKKEVNKNNNFFVANWPYYSLCRNKSTYLKIIT